MLRRALDTACKRVTLGSLPETENAQALQVKCL